MSFQISDKVVCVDDRKGRVELYDYPDGYIVKGKVYVIEGIVMHTYSGTPQICFWIVGNCATRKSDGSPCPWQSRRFRKLDELKAENASRQKQKQNA